MTVYTLKTLTDDLRFTCFSLACHLQVGPHFPSNQHIVACTAGCPILHVSRGCAIIVKFVGHGQLLKQLQHPMALQVCCTFRTCDSCDTHVCWVCGTCTLCSGAMNFTCWECTCVVIVYRSSSPLTLIARSAYWFLTATFLSANSRNHFFFCLSNFINCGVV